MEGVYEFTCLLSGLGVRQVVRTALSPGHVIGCRDDEIKKNLKF